MTGETFLHDSAIVGIIILSVSMVLPAIRLFKGPSLPDRVVALDQITFGFVAIMLTDALLMRHEVLLDVVLIISFILALGTMIISVFLHKHLKRNQRGGE
ncbi:multicomponent Na+:H+ antiporter subunit F [Breznakibacter xylanolyticus]|uniref:Multicomponent Na+:H+ antiporter subunit F n=1 Tax=Breznakibacter xylanolyticus TaxID=990 RepID=A0A2W7NKR5_9BACT|nr:monovalent cation/H+ antiporter complex subunit F [Breznakibacter xylanolyticus]MBN2743694.1 cation:proton antiporter [Marinilabiliaceae bacterium]PZX17254.1 multicomponent Na+:H+ antiporter subunit F [Breznakibacter xylanolyticus]